MTVAHRNVKVGKLSSPDRPETESSTARMARPYQSRLDMVVAEFAATAVKLPRADQQRLFARKGAISELVAAIVASPDIASSPLSIASKGSPESSRGKGLGEIVSAAVGRKRLDAYATPTKLEDWAGLVAGSTELVREFGIARSTLHSWQKKGAVVGLLVGLHKHVFPLEQFVDGRPVAGLSSILDMIGDARTAWLWLRERNPGLSGATPLSLLKAGAITAAIEAARSDFHDR